MRLIDLLEHTLTEMPRLISDFSTHLDRIETNKSFTKSVMNAGYDVLEETDKYLFILNSNENYMVIDKETGLTSFLCELEYPTHFKLSGDYVTQAMIWRSKGNTPNNIVFKTFFDYILPSHTGVISDIVQSEKGRTMWYRLMDKANSMGKTIQYYEGGNIETFDGGNLFDWIEEKKGWSRDKADAAHTKLFIIKN